jgi:hypothetical protein
VCLIYPWMSCLFDECSLGFGFYTPVTSWFYAENSVLLQCQHSTQCCCSASTPCCGASRLMPHASGGSSQRHMLLTSTPCRRYTHGHATNPHDCTDVQRPYTGTLNAFDALAHAKLGQCGLGCTQLVCGHAHTRGGRLLTSLQLRHAARTLW